MQEILFSTPSNSLGSVMAPTKERKMAKIQLKAPGALPDCEYCSSCPSISEVQARGDPANAALSPSEIMIVSLPMIQREQKQPLLIPPWALHTARAGNSHCANGSWIFGLGLDSSFLTHPSGMSPQSSPELLCHPPRQWRDLLKSVYPTPAASRDIPSCPRLLRAPSPPP